MKRRSEAYRTSRWYTSHSQCFYDALTAEEYRPGRLYEATPKMRQRVIWAGAVASSTHSDCSVMCIPSRPNAPFLGRSQPRAPLGPR